MKRVIILGSGFSHSVGEKIDLRIPITKDFFLEASMEEKIGWTKKACPNLWSWVNKLNETKICGTWDIERLYDVVAIANDDHEHVWVGQIPLEAEILKREIEAFVSAFLMRSLKGPETYQKIQAAVFEELIKWNPTSIITLNWDHMVDLAIEEGHDGKQLLERRHGRQFWGWFPKWERKGNEFSLTEPYKRPEFSIEGNFFLKLHGSYTWLSCRDSGHTMQIKASTIPELNLIGDRSRDDYFRCPEDHSKMDFLILPPSSLKDYKKPPFLELWRKALAVLRETDEIIVYGCSFRDADFRLSDLFVKALMARRNQPKVSVKDPNFVEVKKRLETLGYSNVAPID